MTKTTTKAGHIAYSTTAVETAKLGGLGICGGNYPGVKKEAAAGDANTRRGK